MARGPKLGRRGLIVAAVTAGGVLATVLVQDALHGLVSLAWAPSFDVAWSMIQGTLTNSLTSSLPLGVGVFLSLWQLAPIGAELRLGHVVARSVLATGVGSALAFFVGAAVVGVEMVVNAASTVFSGSPEEPPLYLGQGIRGAASIAISQFISTVPLVVLAGILLWLYLRSHDRKYSVEGMLDL